jgi:Meckel syndrome type 1 protein
LTTASLFANPPFNRGTDDVLPRCLLLAVLLHVWLALMIGTQPGVEALGQGAWGSLRVTLLGPSGTTPEGEAGTETTQWRDDGPLGQGPSPRYGGQVRREAAPADSGPGAQNLGRWKAQELPPDPSRSEDEAASPSGNAAQDLAPATKPEPTVTPSPEGPSQSVLSLPKEAAPRSEPRRLEAIDKPKAPTTPAADLAPVPARIELPPEPEPTLRTLDAPTAARPRANLEALSAPRTAQPSRIAPLPSAALPRDVPATLPEPEPTLRTLDAPTAARPRANLEALSAPRTAQPSRVAPLPNTALPRGVPATLPPAPEAATESGQAPAATSAPPGAAPPPGVPSSTLAPTPLTRGDPLANPTPGPRGSEGAPDQGARVGHDVATPPSASASAPLPPLNLNLPRSGGAAAMRRGPGMLEVLPALPERKTPL